MPQPIHALTADECQALAREALPRGAGRARAVYRQVFREDIFDPSLHGVGRYLPDWRQCFSYQLPEIREQVQEADDLGRITAKMVLAGADGLEYECVHIPMGRGRHTLCLSSQVGCKMACAFCETGRMGLLRNLSTAEIVGQVLVAKHRLGLPIGNLVFMGMGEAMDNPEALEQALRVFTDKSGLSLGWDKITVCTVGHAAGIDRLRRLGQKRLNLSLSLNSADEAVRREIMPITRRWSLGAVQEALIRYPQRPNFVLAVNVCLMPGINDRPQDIPLIADFCRPLGRVLVNVIPYNPGKAPLTRAPEEAEIVRYIEGLRAAGLAVRRRITKGRSVMAACGQLGNAELRRG